VADTFEYPAGALIPGTKYKVIRKLGAGGMGIVYEVEDTTIDKRYVLKTLHAQHSTRTDLAERMDKEAKALARLEHKNIVQVITADVTADALKLRYFVMEKLSGHSLRTVLDNKGSLEVDAACRLMIDVLNALYHAHENRIIHRDVKPDNIFLHRDREGVTVPKLLDFGVMTSADAMTMTGHRFIGTLRYAAPEQLLGDKVSAQTDLYAAGLVLYEAIAGRGPFDEAGESMAVASAHLHKAPPKISTFKAVPPALEQLIMSSLAKDANLRPKDAFSFAADLNRFLKELRAAQPAHASEIATIEAILPMTAPPSTPQLPQSPPTALEGQLRGPTSPAQVNRVPLPQAGEARGGPTSADARVAPMSGSSHTLEDASPPEMTVGAAAPLARGAPGVDRSAPTTTYVADAAQPRSQGDTVLMDPSEPRNSGNTIRMAPLASAWGEANGTATGMPNATNGTLSHSPPDGQLAQLRVPATRWGIVVALIGAAIVGLGALVGLGLHFRANAKAAASAVSAPSARASASPVAVVPAPTDVSPPANLAPARSADPISTAAAAPVAAVPVTPPPRAVPKPVISASPKPVPSAIVPTTTAAAADSVVVPKKKKLPPSGL
jgi:serine/threonine protein kinase